MGLHFSTIVSWLVLLLSIQLFKIYLPSSASTTSSSTLSSSRRVDTSPHPAASSVHHHDHHGSDCDPSTCVRTLLNMPTSPGKEKASLVPSNPNVSMTEPERLRRAANPKETQRLQEHPPLDMHDERGSGRSSRKTSRNKKKTQHRHLKRKGDNSNPCRRHRLFVDFHDMGWSNWILSPTGYEVYYCDGECSFPLPTHINSTNHAVVQTLVNSFSPRAVPKACCVPTKLSPIRMVYVNEWNQLIDKTYQDMVVEACGCR